MLFLQGYGHTDSRRDRVNSSIWMHHMDRVNTSIWMHHMDRVNTSIWMHHMDRVNSSIWMHHMDYEKKLDGNCTKMLLAILNKSWKQHPTKEQLYGLHLPWVSSWCNG